MELSAEKLSQMVRGSYIPTYRKDRKHHTPQDQTLIARYRLALASL